MTVAILYTKKRPDGYPISLYEWPEYVRDPVMRGEGYVGPCPCCDKRVVVGLPTYQLTPKAKEYIA